MSTAKLLCWPSICLKSCSHAKNFPSFWNPLLTCLHIFLIFTRNSVLCLCRAFTTPYPIQWKKNEANICVFCLLFWKRKFIVRIYYFFTDTKFWHWTGYPVLDCHDPKGLLECNFFSHQTPYRDVGIIRRTSCSRVLFCAQNFTQKKVASSFGLMIGLPKLLIIWPGNTSRRKLEDLASKR